MLDYRMLDAGKSPSSAVDLHQPHQDKRPRFKASTFRNHHQRNNQRNSAALPAEAF